MTLFFLCSFKIMLNISGFSNAKLFSCSKIQSFAHNVFFKERLHYSARISLRICSEVAIRMLCSAHTCDHSIQMLAPNLKACCEEMSPFRDEYVPRTKTSCRALVPDKLQVVCLSSHHVGTKQEGTLSRSQTCATFILDLLSTSIGEDILFPMKYIY